jgi:MinD superfamily P-loop ATPase
VKRITVISGKGGTGKTVITGCFAVLAGNAVLVDSDVDASNLHLIMEPRIIETHPFRGGRSARIDPTLCSGCGACREACRFDAIEEGFTVDPISCEGCALCARICPEGAVRMEEDQSGEWYLSETPYGPLLHARLFPGEENSGKLVTRIRKAAKEVAEERSADYILIDGPPGTGCPVFASLTDVDIAVVVTEPTLSGLHDLQRVWEAAELFKIPVGVIVNKYDLNRKNADAVASLGRERGMEMLGSIPYSPLVVDAVVRGKPFVAVSNGDLSRAVADIWRRVEEFSRTR